ncbi:MAG TPA: aminotransferase class III-fold pyridoxal phosphate-dependent enzyme [Haliscomenobacter sp.]|mgnify:CR=1 FL=1|uniref:aspartate aminotransferase family protein n=1 Tax=Haliscomenobacter sp. TaxID=2717303 RepID=UPI002C887862|nr:aminotransferase class III-fold pyridoxal phosphate-dependent enzyme [Haliscomenobacter sp.]HOY20025.1 aminotransferase class III-fold pyridoxal phosphate-dependent enzyme [Haliscomenobacter sp.]HPH17427.1 aminotransferase class III-fold pyridoxal phosphate-dependent enzyme [Haliscomenobacter sp.]
MKLFDVYPLYNLKPVRGQGNYVYDEKGQAYLDLYGGHAVISIGHAHPHYVAKLTNQLQSLGFYSNSIQNDLQIELAQKLGALSGCDQYNLFLCNSGAEANENALKMASFHNGRTRVLAFKKGFHGRTSAAVNVTDSAYIQAPINKGFPVDLIAWDDLDAAKKILSQGDVAAVIIEGIQGIGGIYVPNPHFLQELQDLCRLHNTMLILDEIQSGYGRSGCFFAFQHVPGIEPDLITIAKGMGNGFPVGGLLIHPKFKAKHGMLGTTFGGSHLACAASIAVLDVMYQERLVQNAAEVGSYLLDELAKVELIKEIRGEGLMVGMEFDFNTTELRKNLLFDEKVFVGSSSNPNVIRLLPALCLGIKEVDIFMEKLDQALNKLELEESNN